MSGGRTLRSRIGRIARATEWDLARRLVKHLAASDGHGTAGNDEPLAHARSILVIRLDGAGDLILTSAFLRELRRNAPAARITLVVQPQLRNLVELCPYIDEIATFDATGSRHARTVLSLVRALRLARDEFGKRRFDVAIMPRWDIDSYFGSFVARLSDASARVTFSEQVFAKKSRENRGLDELFTRAFNDQELRHEVERGLHLIELLGGAVQNPSLETWLDDRDDGTAARLLGQASPGSRIVALGIGAGQPKREWPLDRYVEVAREIRALGHSVVVVGGERDRHAGAELVKRVAAGVTDTTGRATLRETAAILRRCDLYVGNDAGPMHLASAAGIPVVEISCHPLGGDPLHPNSPARFGPWQVRNAVLRPPHPIAPCRDHCQATEPHCIRGVTTASVIEQARSLLDGSESE